MPAGTVPLVDDDPVIVNLLRVNFGIERFAVLTAIGGEAVLAQSSDAPAGLAVADEHMTKPFGPLELLERAVSVWERARADDAG